MDKSILQKFIGKDVFVDTTSGKYFEGKLVEMDKIGLLISEKSPMAKKDAQDRFIPFSSIVSVL